MRYLVVLLALLAVAGAQLDWVTTDWVPGVNPYTAGAIQSRNLRGNIQYGGWPSSDQYTAADSSHDDFGGSVDFDALSSSNIYDAVSSSGNFGGSVNFVFGGGPSSNQYTVGESSTGNFGGFTKYGGSLSSNQNDASGSNSGNFGGNTKYGGSTKYKKTVIYGGNGGFGGGGSGNAGGRIYGGGTSNSAGYSGGGRTCPTGLLLNNDGICGVPKVSQTTYVYTAPEREIPYTPTPKKAPPKLEYDVIFVRTQEELEKADPIVVPPPQKKTLVYVLSKKKQEEGQKVIEVGKGPPQKPEVFYINYEDGDNPQLPGGVSLQDALQAAAQTGQLIEANGNSGGSVGGYSIPAPAPIPFYGDIRNDAPLESIQLTPAYTG